MSDVISAEQENLRREAGIPPTDETYRWLRRRRRTPRQWTEVLPMYEPLLRDGDIEGAVAFYKGFGMRVSERSFEYVRLVSPRQWKRFWWVTGALLALPTLGVSLLGAALLVWIDRAAEERATIELDATTWASKPKVYFRVGAGHEGRRSGRTSASLSLGVRRGQSEDGMVKETPRGRPSHESRPHALRLRGGV